jgi:hypothetical protein
MIGTLVSRLRDLSQLRRITFKRSDPAQDAGWVLHPMQCASSLSGLSRKIETLHFDAVLARHHIYATRPPWKERLVPFMWDWRVETVVISASGTKTGQTVDQAVNNLEDFLFQGGIGTSIACLWEERFAGWGKVELRVDASVEAAFRKHFDEWIQPFVTAVEDKRLVSLIAFVDEDGTERKLVEE